MIDYKGLSVEFITDYCTENLGDKQYIETICRISTLFNQFNFDMLKALVEEMNRYGESPQQALQMLNTHPEGDTGGQFSIRMFFKGKELEPQHFEPTNLNRNPISMNEISCQAWGPALIEVPVQQTIKSRALKAADPDDDDNTEYFDLTPSDLKGLDANEGTFTYVKGDFRVVFTRKLEMRFSCYDAL
jgi:hypothetical protein